MCSDRPLDQNGNFAKPYFSTEKRGDSDFIRCVHGCRSCPPDSQSIASQLETRELFAVGFEEGHRSELSKINSSTIQRCTVRVCKRVLDRDLHIGEPKLRF